MLLINIGSNSLIQIDSGRLVHTQRMVHTDGELFLNGGDLEVGGAGLLLGNEAGLLRGSGTITAALVEHRSGRIDQTGLTGYQTLHINGAYKKGLGELNLKIGRTENALAFDRLIVSGQATLDGNLTVQPAAGFAAQNGDAASILSFASRVGDFNAGLISIPNGMVTNPGAQTYVIQKLQPKNMIMVPNAGPVFGGTLVTITGEGFLGTTGVSFGGTAAASFTVVSDTEIQAVSPAHGTGTVIVSITSPNGTSDSSSGSTFTYELVNSTTTLSSSQNPAPPGTQVTLTATVTGSGPTPPTGTVEFWEVDPVTGANLALLGTATIDQYGHAVFVWSSRTAGTRRIKALYLGDDNYSSSFAILDQVFGSGPGSGSG